MAENIGHPVDLEVSTTRQLAQLAESIPDIVRAGVVRPTSLRSVGTIVASVARRGFSLAFLTDTARAYSPDALALIDDTGSLTFQQLATQSQALARALRGRGLQAGDKLAIIARNSRYSVLAMVGAAYGGISAMIMNPMSSPMQLARTLRAYDAAAVIVDEEFAAPLLEENPQLGVDVPVFIAFPDTVQHAATAGYESVDKLIEHAPTTSLGLRSKRYPTIIMSSGTTGLPKGVVRGVPKTPQVLGSILPKIPWRVGMTVQLSASLFHAWGWLNLNLCLATKSTMVLRRYFDGEQAMDDALEHDVDAVVSAAVFLKELEREAVARETGEKPGAVPGGIEFIASSGNAIPPSLVAALTQRFGPVVCNFYGSTEHGPIAVASGPELAADPDRAGTVATGVCVRIYTSDGREAQPGEVGMIYSANSESMRGYLSAHDTAAVRDGLLGTGDLGFFDRDGFLHVRGRYDDMIIRGGENVYPRELEELLESQEGIADAYVKGYRDGINGYLNAYIVRDDTAVGAAWNDNSVKELALRVLAQHNVPDNIAWLDALPRNDAGKVIPRELPEFE